MKNLNQVLLMGGVAVLLSLSAGNAAAQQQRQGRGNFDPAEFRQRMLDRYKEQLEVKGDDEWKIISERIEKVTTLQREVRIGSFGNFGGRRGGGGDRNTDGNNTNRERTNRPGSETNPDVEALQKALEAKASADELKSKLSKLREAQKDKEAKLSKAQDELRKVLSVRQEATAVLMGLLK